MNSHSPALPSQSSECADMAARAQRVWSGLRRTAVSVLVVAGLAFTGAPVWAKDKPIVADDVQCDGCVGTTDVEDGSLTRGDLSFDPQERVNGSCPAGSSIRAINADGSVSCETDTDTDTLNQLAADPKACPDGSFVQLVPLGSGQVQWQCLSLFDMKVALGLAQPQAKKFVFVTAATYDGNLGGEPGADAKCNQAAVAAGLSGTYFAFVGTSGTNPYDLLDAAAAYTLVDGTPVFEKADLATCNYNVDCLAHPIDLDASGNPQSGVDVWTGLNVDFPDGGGIITDDSRYCRNWTSNAATTSSGSSSDSGVIGLTSAKDAHWYSNDVPDCNSLEHLYCMEK